MKQIFLIALALALFSCTGSNPKSASSFKHFELEELLAVAEHNLNDTVAVIGYVTHTCKHSGKRCFIESESVSSKISMRVEAGDGIGGFSPELVGAKLAITGVLKEYHLSAESIDEREERVNHLQHQEGMEETCAAELSNIEEMRAWMKEKDKDYYVIYYMDGLKYEVLD